MPSANAVRTRRETHTRTRIACIPCRRGKRRCDGGTPSCELCTRKATRCSYPTSQSTQSTRLLFNRSTSATRIENDVSFETRVVSGRSSSTPESPPPAQSFPLTASSETTAIYFISRGTFEQAGLKLSQANLRIPPAAEALAGDASKIRGAAIAYFDSIHTWFPIIAKKIFFTRIFNPLSPQRTELTLLVLCMQLCSVPLPKETNCDPDGTATYLTTKRFFKTASDNLLSIHVLQAGLLIAIYEITQAIYPAAYITIASCAEYGRILGIHKLDSQLMGDQDGDHQPWQETEERRRVWWGVIILDRFLSMSNPTRKNVTADPTLNTYLPVDDQLFEDGTSKPGDAVVISSGLMLTMGLFSRLAQAVYLLNQALKIVSRHASACNSIADNSEVVQLNRTLIALVHLSDNEAAVRKIEFCPQTAVCFSAIILLQEFIWYEQTRALGIHGIPETLSAECQEAMDRMATLATDFRDYVFKKCTEIEGASLFITHVIFQVASLDVRMRNKLSKPAITERIRTARGMLDSIGQKWRLARLYTRILDAKEAVTLLDTPT